MEPDVAKSIKRVYRKNWSTKNEIDFLKGLGTWAPHAKALFEGANYERMLLKNYIKGAKERTTWGVMRQREILRFAEERLRYL